MRGRMENVVHHLRETVVLFGTNKVSNLLSLLSTTLVFLFLGLILVGWRASAHWVALIRSEAEIQVFLAVDAGGTQYETARTQLLAIPGVEQVETVSADEAQTRMASLLGGEAGVLSHLEKNPFRPFLEVRIRLDAAQSVAEAAAKLADVETVRDNREVLDSLIRIEQALRVAGLVFGGAVALFTLVLLSHITRVGVVHNREQIRTLRLLGAPEGHVSAPFFLLGLLLGAGGGVLAAGILSAGLRILPGAGSDPIPFLPLPGVDVLARGLLSVLAGTGATLGVLGTASGLVSARRRRRGHDLP